MATTAFGEESKWLHHLAGASWPWDVPRMANVPTPPPEPAPIPVISARDTDFSRLFPADFENLYEVHSYRNAARILATSCQGEFQEIVDTLMRFRIPTNDIVVG